MIRSAVLSACLLCSVAVASVSAAPSEATRKIMPGNHRPVYTRYGHHGLTRQGLFNMFRRNGSGIPRKVHFKKDEH